MKRWVVASVVAGVMMAVPLLAAAQVPEEDAPQVEVPAPAGAPAPIAAPAPIEPPAATAPPAPPPVAEPALPARLAKRYVVRPELNLTYKGDIGDIFGPLADASSLGLTIGGNVIERLSIEATIGYAPGQSGTSSSATYEIAGGATFMGVARVAALMNATGRHALTFAGGTYALLSGGYGPTAFAHAEAAYEFRGTYVTVLTGYGANIALNRSAHPTMSCGLFGSTCEVGFDPGDLLGHIRISVGATF